MMLLGMIALAAGLFFKISAVPFHMWAPDAYEGAPTSVTAFLSTGSKAASFALYARIFMVALEPMRIDWAPLLGLVAAITIVVGNWGAITQENSKRLLAYSSIAQAGYTLIGVASLATVAGQNQAVAAITFYMFMYTFTNLLAFGVVILFTNATGSENIADLAGLSKRSPMLALAMTIALLSLAGIPPAAGFLGKFFLFQAAVQSGLVWLAIVGVLNAIVALYYYLVVIKVMYVDRSEDEDKPIKVSQTYIWVLGATAIVVVLLGTFLATPIFEWATRGASALFGVGV